MPSKTQMRPNETRNRRRATGSGRDIVEFEVPVAPALARRSCAERWTFHATEMRAMIKRTTSP